MKSKHKPYNPAAATAAAVHDRQATDLIRNIHTAPALVPDPLALNPGDMIVVVRQFRDDPLGRMHVRRQITDTQFAAGRAFQRDWEAAERGPRAIDPSKEYVDGGVPAEPITERQRTAAKQLNHAMATLGQIVGSVVSDVLVGGCSMAVVAKRRDLVGKRWEEYFGMLFRQGLTCLETVYGLSNARG
jgi:hypothetical protein